MQMLKRRDAIEPPQKKSWDDRINKQLLRVLNQGEIKVVHLYLPMRKEVDISPFIEQALVQKVTVVAPRALPNRNMEHLPLRHMEAVEEGLFGTRHPRGSCPYRGKYDLVIVPGLAFDEQHYRLGYGGGYYDTFLKQHPAAYTLGVAYPFQLITEVPRESHDIPLRKIIS